jgi:uncharacterized protein
MNTALAQLADRFCAAIETADLQALRAIYATDAVIWHNYNSAETTAAQNIAVIGTFPALFDSFAYTEIRREFFTNGFVQQHVARGRKKSGETFAVPVCMVVRVRGEHIVRIDEYFDSAHDARPEDYR